MFNSLNQLDKVTPNASNSKVVAKVLRNHINALLIFKGSQIPSRTADEKVRNFRTVLF